MIVNGHVNVNGFPIPQTPLPSLLMGLAKVRPRSTQTSRNMPTFFPVSDNTGARHRSKSFWFSTANPTSTSCYRITNDRWVTYFFDVFLTFCLLTNDGRNNIYIPLSSGRFMSVMIWFFAASNNLSTEEIGFYGFLEKPLPFLWDFYV